MGVGTLWDIVTSLIRTVSSFQQQQKSMVFFVSFPMVLICFLYEGNKSCSVVQNIFANDVVLDKGSGSVTYIKVSSSFTSILCKYHHRFFVY